MGVRWGRSGSASATSVHRRPHRHRRRRSPQQPANAGVVEGQPASFSVAASITPAAALTYQWSRRADGSTPYAPIAGATAATFNLAATALTDNGSQFQVAVCAAPSLCVISQPGHARGHAEHRGAPSFTLQPANIAIVAGQTASFTVTATGNPLPRIDWQSATASDPNNFTSLSVAPNCVRTDPPASGTSTTATCTVGPLAIADSGRRCRGGNQQLHHHQRGGHAHGERRARGARHHSAARAPEPSAPSVAVLCSASPPPAPRSVLPEGAQRHAAASISGQFNTGNCIGDVTYSNGNATITLTGVTGGCNGVVIDVTVSNGVRVSNEQSRGVDGRAARHLPWATQTVNFRNALTSVFAVNSGTAWATSASGEVLRTIDGGATWSVQVSGGNNLSDISAVDANTAWAVGGEVHRQDDRRRRHMVPADGAAGEYLYSVSAVNARVSGP